MKKTQIFLALAAAVAMACQNPKKESAENETGSDTVAVTLTKKWETKAELTTCESVIYDKKNDVLYVANINGNPAGKDGNGFISKVSLEGEITEAQWAKGMDAPKGMGLANDKLYVSDIDRVHEVDLASGAIVKTYPVEGAQFLNDVATDDSGRVYISDSNTGVISMIENGQLSKWMENIAGGPNGLLVQGNKMMVATFQGAKLNTVDMATKQITENLQGIENADGIEAMGDGEYLVSSWNGMVHHISADWKRTTLLDTRADSVNAADIEYIPERNLLLVPAFFKNKVVAYEVKE